jgi:uncharacterized protein YndB with AHSA1/START domain
MSAPSMTLPPVSKSLRLDCTAEEAFRAFTEEFSLWWPSATHSLGRAENVQRVVFEARANGRLYEVWRDGSEHSWGVITAWDPPHRVTFTWHVGRDPRQASEVTIRVMPTEDGCLVDLVHSNWESLGAEADKIREGYESGWGEVFLRVFREYATSRLRSS